MDHAKTNTMPPSQNQEDPTPKKKAKLQSSEPDLRVIVQCPARNKEDPNKEEEDDDKEEEQLLEKEYHMYADVLATQSDFVDTALSTEMKEKQTRTIHFQCESPALFDKAMLYLTDYQAAKNATAMDVLKVVGFYHMYQFHEGLAFADEKICERVEKAEKHCLRCCYDELRGLDHSFFEHSVEAIVVANKLGLEKSGKAAIEFINSAFALFDRWDGPAHFTEEIVSQLQAFLHNHYDSINLGLYLDCDASREEVASSLFPKYFCQITQISSITLKDTGIKAIDGMYFFDKDRARWQDFAGRKFNIGGCRYKVYLSKMEAEDMDHWTFENRNLPVMHTNPLMGPAIGPFLRKILKTNSAFYGVLPTAAICVILPKDHGTVLTSTAWLMELQCH
jgi:hypothetical protein